MFYDYGAIPFGTVADSVFPGSTWTSTGSGSTYTVTMSGMYQFVPFSVSFRVAYIGNAPSVVPLYVSVLGEQQSAGSFLDDAYELYYNPMDW